MISSVSYSDQFQNGKFFLKKLHRVVKFGGGERAGDIISVLWEAVPGLRGSHRKGSSLLKEQETRRQQGMVEEDHRGDKAKAVEEGCEECNHVVCVTR